MQDRPPISHEAGAPGPRPPVERRGALRFPIDQPVRYKVTSRRPVETGQGKSVNISSTGVLFTSEGLLAPGERVEVSVNWPAQLDQKHPLKLVASGRVVRITGAGEVAIAIDRHEFRTQGANRLVP
jgi:c-di-GMP-binding flagellar brake protein YcgR